MSLIGAHVSIAGGIEHAPARAREEGCETFQCFTRSPQGGPAPELTPDVIAKFRDAMQEADIRRFVIHAPYYINLASQENRIRHSSVSVIRQELERGSALDAQFVMFHPGSYTDQTYEEAVVTVQKGMVRILEGYEGSCKLLIEISAGAGNVLGDRFQEVADMMSPVIGHAGFGGVCFDTCHAFASGYDFRTPETAAAVLGDFDRVIGLEMLKLSHVQDSKADLGGHKDRHEHIGGGFVGQEGLEALLKTSRFRAIDWILETESDGRLEDIRILKEIRG